MAHWSSVSELVYMFKHWLSRHYGFYFLLQISLQLSCGAFMLDSALCDTINVPMDKLKWTSPFTSHRISLTHVSHSGSRRSESLEVHHSSSPPPKDSDLNSECEELVSRTSSSSFQARSPRMEGKPSLFSGFSSMSTEAPAITYQLFVWQWTGIWVGNRGDTPARIAWDPAKGRARPWGDGVGDRGCFGLAGTQFGQLFHRVGADRCQGQLVARWTDRPRGPRPGIGQSCGQSALHHPQTLGREPAAQHALLQPQQYVRPDRVGTKLQTMRSKSFTRLELF